VTNAVSGSAPDRGSGAVPDGAGTDDAATDLGGPARRSPFGSLGGGRMRRGRPSGALGWYVARRVAVVPLLLFGIVTIAFLISRLIPADPIISIVGERQVGNEAVVEAAKARWGLDRSLPEQYLIYLQNIVLHGDFGTSFSTRQPVTQDILQRLPATVELALAALVIAVVGGVALGVLAASRQNRFADHASRVVALLGSSLPVFWTGLVLLSIFYARLGWLPGPGRAPGRVTPPPEVTGLYTIDSLLAGDLAFFWYSVERLALPAFVLGWAFMGIVSRLVRGAMLDELGADYVRTARAKGVTERVVMVHHVLRNALLPVLTVLGFSFATLITGAVLTETVFSWNGIGSYIVDATRTLDYPAINAVCVLGGAIFLLVNLVTDLLYLVADPKVRLT
jgi:ABC-type dipeptide/oligopeptide/nickel transport system permease component